uniref:Guanylate cyclase domain-containing protein n=1 Tax=Dunaliella tertiolecta TaxID=3047 RepID=A0A7S3R8N7_DUNTE|eukprot:CAMPEP_0202369764 /NCGR_PEP_ID=MMETSP1127-20130417/1525_1 /ASSEMBLY_ACC=CAM_ASM_000462 /TAXON_ID=3047 /ORGANISM="Dunaliella tertiolecta, Strain CCMP1320" /LENGTH=1773 /DNA_ID=CAMNT_0048965523 /DNA_START=86 /DNA_END=5407 /DNA_ORIENTATION=+
MKLFLWACFVFTALGYSHNVPPQQLDSPAFTQELVSFFTSASFLESVRACFPNSTSPFPQLVGPDLPQSQCLLAAGILPSQIEQMRGMIVANNIAMEELDLISTSGIAPHIILDINWANGIFRTMVELFHGGNQFGREYLKPSLRVRPTLWQMPSSLIGMFPRSNASSGVDLVLGEACMPNSANLGIVRSQIPGGEASDEENSQSSSNFVGSSSSSSSSSSGSRDHGSADSHWRAGNLSTLVASARIQDVSTAAFDGSPRREQELALWENKAATAAAKAKGLSSQGPIFPRDHMLLFYRADWFKELGLSVPNTWDELTSLATALSQLHNYTSLGVAGEGPPEVQGWNLDRWPSNESLPAEPIELLQRLPVTSSNYSSSGDSNSSRNSSSSSSDNNLRFALCLDLAPYCKGAFLLNAVMASVSQTQGTWQNAFMDPVDTELLAVQHPELMRETLQVYRSLAQASHLPTSLHSCAAVNHLFATGRCAMTIDWGYAFMYMYNIPPVLQTSEASGNRSSQRAAPHPFAIDLVDNVGVSPLPGSSRTYDRAERVVKECSPSTCPLATQEVIVTYSWNASNLLGSPSKASDGSGSSFNSSQSSHHSSGGGIRSDSSGSASSRTGSSDQESSRGASSSNLGSQQVQSSALTMGDKQLVDGQRTAWVNRAPYSVFIAGITALCNPTLDTSGQETRVYQTQRMSAASQTVSSIVLPPAVFEAAKRAIFKSKLDKLGEGAAARAHALVTKGDLGVEGDLPFQAVPDFSDEELASWWLEFEGKPEDELGDVSERMFLSVPDSRRYLQALWKARYTYRNQAPDFTATPVVSRAHRLVMEEAALYVAAAPSFSMDTAVGGVKKRSIDAMQADPSSKQTMQAALWRATAFDASMLEAPTSGLTPAQLAGSIAGPVVFTILVAVGALLLWLHSNRRKKHQTLWGASIPPKAGPQTTLLLTDIESSTQMWETLPERVCDEVISLHHEVIRTLLDVYQGYECGTEGDAFVLAFHTVADALLFAASSQVELLLAAWPAELLELETCRPVYVQPIRAGPTSKHLRHSRRSSMLSPVPANQSLEAEQCSSQGMGGDSGSMVRINLDQGLQTRSNTLKHSVSGSLSAAQGQMRRGFGRCKSLVFKGSKTTQGVAERSKQRYKSNTYRIASMAGEPAAQYQFDTDKCRETREWGMSGLLAFDAALLDATQGGYNEDALDYNHLVQRYPSRFAVRSSMDASRRLPKLSPISEPYGVCATSSDLEAEHAEAGPESQHTDVNSCIISVGNSDMLRQSPQSQPHSNSSEDASLYSRRERQPATLPSHYSAPLSLQAYQANHAYSPLTSCSNIVLPVHTSQHSQPLPHIQSSGMPRASSQGPTVGQQLVTSMPRVEGPGPGALLVLRGLRVRMGAASGVEQEDVHMQGAQGRAQYSGPTMAAAKAVVDAAQGGMVLISSRTFQQVPAKLLHGQMLFAFMGEHVLKGEKKMHMQLYQVLPRQLVHRAAQLGPVRSIQQLSQGFLEAPSNSAAICFMTVSYLKALEAWNPDVTAAALELWHGTVQGILTKRGGYLVEAVDGLCLAAFAQPAAAIRWAIECIKACLHLSWPAELLESDLGEEKHYTPAQSFANLSKDDFLPTAHAIAEKQNASFASNLSCPRVHQVLLFRGLRIKVGIDWGPVKADLHAATARVTFRGRVMNRASRISDLAKSGEVWCSENAWEAAAPEINHPVMSLGEATKRMGDGAASFVGSQQQYAEEEPSIQRPTIVTACPLGMYKLKGIANDMLLFRCVQYCASAAAE